MAAPCFFMMPSSLSKNAVIGYMVLGPRLFDRLSLVDGTSCSWKTRELGILLRLFIRLSDMSHVAMRLGL